jgi:hypothetical protein
MFKRVVLLSIILFQLVGLASSVAVSGVADRGTPLGFSSAVIAINQDLLAQLNPIKALLNISVRLANTSTPCQPAHNNKQQTPPETTLIISSVQEQEIVKTNMLLWASSAIDRYGGLPALVMLLLLIVAYWDGIVLCRIQHLFVRAREGICAARLSYNSLKWVPLIRQRLTGFFYYVY